MRTLGTRPQREIIEFVKLACSEMPNSTPLSSDSSLLRKVIRELITGLAPRAQADLGFIEKTAAMMQRMDASRTAELNKLAEEEKRTAYIRTVSLTLLTYIICFLRAYHAIETRPTRTHPPDDASSCFGLPAKDD